MQIRLQKYLAQSNIASRRYAEKLILNGEIKVNDIIIKKLGTKITIGEDIVKYKNKVVNLNNNNIYIMLNKPERCVTTVKDQFNRLTVIDLLQNKDKKVHPVGRLDYDTSGLLLLTNDGRLTYKLTHPKYKIYKTYIATVTNSITEDKIRKLQEGVVIDNFKTSSAKVKIIRKDLKKTIVEISIYEGKNRQIRKMFSSIGNEVLELKRISIYNLYLGNLKKGKYRYLNTEELKQLKLL